MQRSGIAIFVLAASFMIGSSRTRAGPEPADPGATQPPEAGAGSRSVEENEQESPQILFDRARWFFEGRTGPSGTIPWNARNHALAQLEENQRQGLLKSDTTTIAADTW